MGNSVVINGEIENYSDELGNQIVGKLRGNGKIIFSGENARIMGGGILGTIHICEWKVTQL